MAAQIKARPLMTVRSLRCVFAASPLIDVLILLQFRSLSLNNQLHRAIGR